MRLKISIGLFLTVLVGLAAFTVKVSTISTV
jgi:hypothetical protein